MEAGGRQRRLGHRGDRRHGVRRRVDLHRRTGLRAGDVRRAHRRAARARDAGRRRRLGQPPRARSRRADALRVVGHQLPRRLDRRVRRGGAHAPGGARDRRPPRGQGAGRRAPPPPPGRGRPPVGMALAGGRLYLTGVGSVGDQARDGAISLDAATGAPTSWFVPGMRDAIAVSPDGAEAYFTRGQIAGWPWQGAIAASTAGGALLPWTPSGTSLKHARTPGMSPDGKSVLLWNLASGARTRAGAAMLDETGTVTPWVDPVARFEHPVRASSAAIDAAGTTYTTQMPRDSNTGPRTVEAVDAAGALRFQLAVDGEATATLSPDQQTLYVVGTFTAIGGVTRPGLAALRTADGSLVDWPLTVAGGAVSRVVFSPDGATMYLTGTFTAVNGVPRTRVAAVDAGTGAVLPFNPAPDREPGLAVSPDGRVVYLYGDFEHVA